MRRVNEVASHQYGVFNRLQLREAGFDRFAVGRRVESGEWIRMCPNVFALASAPPKWERQMAAAVLSRPEACVAGRSAAYLLGLRGFGKGRPAVVVPPNANTRLTIGRVIRSKHFSVLATETVAGFQVTSTAETLMMLARDLSAQRLEACLEDALLAGKVTVPELRTVLAREDGAPGTAMLGQLVIEHSEDAPTPDSTYLEALLERLLRRAKIPVWHREFPFSIGGAPARVDVFIPDWDLVIEADGRPWHGRMRDQEADKRRDGELAARGIQVIRLTYSMLTEEPHECLRVIREAGRHRSAGRSG
ncbi:MAG TPA: type IV toxin-antitoxin system AbiEi family antitoxin domain-containing protein [Acidimicrobiia bacterium]